MRKTSNAKMYVMKRIIVPRFLVENNDWGFNKLSGNKINHEFVNKEKNFRKKSKKIQQNHKTTTEMLKQRYFG